MSLPHRLVVVVLLFEAKRLPDAARILESGSDNQDDTRPTVTSTAHDPADQGARRQCGSGRLIARRTVDPLGKHRSFTPHRRAVSEP